MELTTCPHCGGSLDVAPWPKPGTMAFRVLEEVNRRPSTAGGLAEVFGWKRQPETGGSIAQTYVRRLKKAGFIEVIGVVRAARAGKPPSVYAATAEGLAHLHGSKTLHSA